MDAFKTHGAFSWNELMTPDPAAAASFYGQLFGWQVSPPRADMGDYRVASLGETMVAMRVDGLLRLGTTARVSVAGAESTVAYLGLEGHPERMRASSRVGPALADRVRIAFRRGSAGEDENEDKYQCGPMTLETEVHYAHFWPLRPREEG